MLKPIQRVASVKIINAVKKINLGKTAGSSEVNTEMTVASRKTGLVVMVKLCLHNLLKLQFNLTIFLDFSLTFCKLFCVNLFCVVVPL